MLWLFTPTLELETTRAIARVNQAIIPRSFGVDKPTESEVFLRKRLRLLREKSGLTQTAIAELSGVSYDYYQNIEQGKRPNVSIRFIHQIAKAYGLTVHELFSPELPRVKVKLKMIPSPHYKKRKSKFL